MSASATVTDVSQAGMTRYKVLLGAIIVQLILGTIYGYSIFWKPLESEIFPTVITEAQEAQKIEAGEDVGRYHVVATEAEIGEHDAALLTDRIMLGGRLFELAVDAPGSKLTLAPSSGTLADVKLPVAPERLTLVTEAGGEFVMLYRPERSVKLPPGSYKVVAYQLYRKDDQGDLWFLVGAATRQTAFVKVAATQGAKLEFGEPFITVGAVPEKTYKAFAKEALDRVPVEFRIQGVGRELIGELLRVSGNRTKTPLDETRSRPLEPTYIILKGSRIVTRGAFEYG